MTATKMALVPVLMFGLLGTVLLMACGTENDPDKLKGMPTMDLCESYHFAAQPSYGTLNNWSEKKELLKKELERRNAVTPAEWPMIDQGQIQTGSSECALRAAWGFPQRVDRASTFDGNSAHYVYSVARYADLTNGKVTQFKY